MIKNFELFHGAVLTKLMRNTRPLTLRLVQTRPDDNWAVYTLNDEIDIFIKHCTSPRENIRAEGGLSWTFTFNQEHIKELRELKEKRPISLALVCGQKNLSDGRMEICLIKPDELHEVINFDVDDQKSITVRYKKGAKKLRIYFERQEKLLVALNAIENWEIPGS